MYLTNWQSVVLDWNHTAYRKRTHARHEDDSDPDSSHVSIRLDDRYTHANRKLRTLEKRHFCSPLILRLQRIIGATSSHLAACDDEEEPPVPPPFAFGHGVFPSFAEQLGADVWTVSVGPLPRQKPKLLFHLDKHDLTPQGRIERELRLVEEYW
eukprot:GSA120T00006188001.1